MESFRWESSHLSRLTQFIANHTGIACIDFDNTFISGDFGETLMMQFVREGLLNVKNLEGIVPEAIPHRNDPNALSDIIWKKYNSILETAGTEFAYRWSSFLFSGWEPTALKAKALVVWQDSIEKKILSPFPEMESILQLLLKNNWKPFIVTSSPTLIIQPIATLFQIPEDSVLGMNLVVEQNLTTALIHEPFTYGEGKVRAIETTIGTGYELAFGDSKNDFPMLKRAKMGVLLHRGNEELLNDSLHADILIQTVQI
jgi:phosphoserine phosphatase